MEELTKINNVCCLFRKRFLERGGYFALDAGTSEAYLTYLLLHDKLEILQEHLEKAFLKVDGKNLLDKNGDKISFCAHNFWVDAPEEYKNPSRVALFIIRSGVSIITCRGCRSDSYVMEENTETMVDIIRFLINSLCKTFTL
jgi:hypothetical protein